MPDRNFITVVSGLPRSGTSMMMKMLEAGGLEAMTDNIRRADVDNPLGYYEFERVKKIKDDSSWVGGAVGRVFKMVAMLLYDLPPGFSYRVVFMRRDMGEMLDSQEKMLKRLGKDVGAAGREKIASLYLDHLSRVEGWLSLQPYIKTLYVNYRDVIADPRGSARRVNDFLGGGLDVEKMALTVDSSLYRNRSKTG